MAENVEKHRIISELRQLSISLGRVPTVAEFQQVANCPNKTLRHYFGSFDELIKAADVSFDKPHVNYENLTKRYNSLCSRMEKIQGFFVHTLDLEDLFRRAGNPEVLKLQAWPDVHVKFRDVAAVNCATKFLSYYNPHIHLFWGDFADCEGLSHWEPKDLAPRRIVPEMKESRALLQQIVDASPQTVARIFCEGNHERWITEAFARFPQLFDGLDELGIDVSVRSLLGLDKFGYELYPLNHLVRIGKAHFTHGMYCGTHHAKKHLDVLKCNVFYGHLHDTQEANQTSIYGPIEAASGGTLARLDAKFLRGLPNNWVHSVSNFEFFRDGSFNRYKILIKDGKTAYNGIVFDGN